MLFWVFIALVAAAWAAISLVTGQTFYPSWGETRIVRRRREPFAFYITVIVAIGVAAALGGMCLLELVSD